MLTWWKLLAAAGIAVALSGGQASAHPHVWVSTKTEIVYDAEGRVTAFHHHWTFDEVFSAFASQGMDKNGDGKFDRAELAELAETNITSLSDFDFFTFPEVGGKDVALTRPPDGYYLSHEKDKLTLHFTLPLKEPVDTRREEFSFAIYDPTYFVDFAYDEKSPVWLSRSAPRACAVTMHEPEPETAQEQKLSDLGEAFYNELGPGSDFGAQFAKHVVVACKTS